MTERRTLKRTAAALLVLAGAVALTPTFAPGLAPARAEDESPQAVIERLTPQLRSQDEEVRDRAERKLFALGENGRQELERLAQGTDPTLSSLALRLLARDEWKTRATDGGGSQSLKSERPLEEQLRKLEEDVGKRFENLRQQLRNGVGERIDLSDLTENLPEGAVQSGTVVENGHTFSWSKKSDGHIDVTVQDSPDAEKQTYAFDSLDAAKKEAPEIAKRLEEHLAGVGRSGLHLQMPRFELNLSQNWPRMPEFRIPHEQMNELRRYLRDQVDPDDHAALSGPVLGITWEEPSEVLRTQLDLPSRAMVVTDVRPDTAAARLGLARHDVLLTLAGSPVSAPEDVRKALDSVAEGDQLTAEVVRKGKHITLEARR